MRVCPTKATSQDEEGVIRVDKDLCIGCRYCMVVCPYGARYFTEKWESYFPKDHPLSEFEQYAKEQWDKNFGDGVATKCDFCMRPGRAGAQPGLHRRLPRQGALLR